MMNTYESFFRQFQRIYDVNAMTIHSQLKRMPSNILDLCCGPGLFTRSLHAAFPNARIIGVDANHEFIQAAQASKEAKSPRVSFVCSDAKEFMERTKRETETLIVVRAAYHFIESVLPLLALVPAEGSKDALAIIERTSLSAHFYPVPDAAKEGLFRLTSFERQGQFHRAGMGMKFSSFSYGEVVSSKTDALVAAVRSRQFSYLNKVPDEPIEDWSKDILHHYPDSIDIFDEYVVYLYQR